MTITASGCVPLRNVTLFGGPSSANRECIAAKRRGFSAIHQIPPEFAIFFARWSSYLPRDVTVGGGSQKLLGTAKATSPAKDQHRLFVRSLRKTIAYLRGLGTQRILIVGLVPELPSEAPSCVERAWHYGIDPSTPCSTTTQIAEVRQKNAEAWTLEAIAGMSDVQYIDPVTAMCDLEFCRPFEGNVLLYRDDDHLSHVGVEKLYRANEWQFAWLFGSDRAD
jgi:post-segregation antitoxin (ccd killing protein)